MPSAASWLRTYTRLAALGLACVAPVRAADLPTNEAPPTLVGFMTSGAHVTVIASHGGSTKLLSRLGEVIDGYVLTTVEADAGKVAFQKNGRTVEVWLPGAVIKELAAPTPGAAPTKLVLPPTFRIRPQVDGTRDPKKDYEALAHRALADALADERTPFEVRRKILADILAGGPVIFAQPDPRADPLARDLLEKNNGHVELTPSPAPAPSPTPRAEPTP